MDPVSITIGVVTVLWRLTISTKKAFGDSKANNVRTKRLESKANALATIVGEAGNLYRTDVTGAGDLPATAGEKGAKERIQEELSECESDLKRHNEQIEKILRSQRRGNPILIGIKDKLLDNDVGLDLDQIEKSITDHQSQLQLLLQVIQGHRMSEIHKNLYQFLSIIIAHVKSSGASQLPKRPDDAINATTDPRSQRDVNLTPTQSANHGADEGEENPVDAEDLIFLHDSVQTFFTEQLDSLRLGSLSAPSDPPLARSPSSSNRPEIATTGEEQPNISSNSDEPLDNSQHPLGDDRTSLEERNEFDQTPLILAASSGEVDIVKSLVEQGANVEAKDQEGATALHVAIGKARWSVVSFLLQPGTYTDIEATNLLSVNSCDNLGRTPLHTCALLNCSDEHTTTAIQQLLDLGADVNMRDKGDHAPLYYAVKGPPKYDVIELLLQNGTDIDFEWPPDISPRIKDILEKHRGILEY